MHDPWELSYCVESVLGKMMLKNPTYYRRFAKKLRGLLDRQLSAQNFSRALNTTVKLLSARLGQEDTVLAMLQFHDQQEQPASPADAVAQIKQVAQDLLSDYADRRTVLQNNLSDYEQARSIPQHQFWN